MPGECLLGAGGLCLWAANYNKQRRSSSFLCWFNAGSRSIDFNRRIRYPNAGWA